MAFYVISIILATVSKLLAPLEITDNVCPVSIIILLPAINSKLLPTGMGISFARNTDSVECNLILAFICAELVLANVSPITTVVVAEGTVYTSISALADVLEVPLYTLFLKVLAIYTSLTYII
tara:strand:- start:552 stop:920 length:369 start_codon:yes stop_codon:yes gene_type:complete